MKTTSDIFSRTLPLTAWLLGCFLTYSSDPAAAADKPGFVRLVDAVAQGRDKLLLFIDGELMNPDGYVLGDVTGGMGLQPGTHEISLKRPGVSEGVTHLNLASEHTITLIPFAERVAATDDKPAHWAMRILRLRQIDPVTQRSATFVSVSQTPELNLEIRAPYGKWTAVTVKRLSVAQSPILYPEGYVPLRCNARNLPSIPVGEPGNYVVVLYDDAAGALQALNLQDYKYLSAD
ncbi:MAG: hypothetical protein DVB25_00070 [Verrucomicrobia bacterium]|nr:MAG: hypothetical protein DVB25_00070 [Verrucomicrobiota bacterium]